jgi:hypothetical protein
MSKTTDATELQALSQGLAAVTVRLDPREAKTPAVTLTQAMSKTLDPYTMGLLVQRLVAVAAQLNAEDARAVASAITGAIGKPALRGGPNDPVALQSLAEGLATLAEHVDPREAKEAASTLTQAMTKTKDPFMVQALAEGLVALAPRLGQPDAKDMLPILTQAMSNMPLYREDWGHPRPPWEAWPGRLTPVTTRMLPKDVAAILTQAMGKTTRPDVMKTLARWLASLPVNPGDVKEAASILTQAITGLSQVSTCSGGEIRPVFQGLRHLA